MAGTNIRFAKAYKNTTDAGISYRQVVIYGNNEEECAVCNSANTNIADIIGVAIENQTKDNKGIAVCLDGIVDCIAAGAIAYGAEVVTSTAGKVTTIKGASLEQNATANILGIAESAAGADGDIVKVRIEKRQRAVTAGDLA